MWFLFEFSELNDLWLNLLIELFECKKTASFVCYRIFRKAAEYSSREKLQKLLPVIRKLLENTNDKNANVRNN